MTEPATVAEFQGWARDVIADCRGRGVTPVLVGGSALYTRAVLDRFEFPGTDPAVRRQLEDELAEGPEAMHRRLTAVDADAAAKIEPGNGRRIVRARLVVAITGRPFSRACPSCATTTPTRTRSAWTSPPGARRADRAAGAADVGGRLRRRGTPPRRPRPAGGPHREPRPGLPAGARLPPTARSPRSRPEQTVTGTRRFARRQDSWFRKDPRITWVGWDDPERVAKALAAVAAARDAAEV